MLRTFRLALIIAAIISYSCLASQKKEDTDREKDLVAQLSKLTLAKESKPATEKEGKDDYSETLVEKASALPATFPKIKEIPKEQHEALINPQSLKVVHNIPWLRLHKLQRALELQDPKTDKRSYSIVTYRLYPTGVDTTEEAFVSALRQVDRGEKCKPVTEKENKHDKTLVEKLSALSVAFPKIKRIPQAQHKAFVNPQSFDISQNVDFLQPHKLQRALRLVDPETNEGSYRTITYALYPIKVDTTTKQAFDFEKDMAYYRDRGLYCTFGQISDSDPE